MLTDYGEWHCDNCGQLTDWSEMVIGIDEVCDQCHELRAQEGDDLNG